MHKGEIIPKVEKTQTKIQKVAKGSPGGRAESSNPCFSSLQSKTTRVGGRRTRHRSSAEGVERRTGGTSTWEPDRLTWRPCQRNTFPAAFDEGNASLPRSNTPSPSTRIELCRNECTMSEETDGQAMPESPSLFELATASSVLPELPCPSPTGTSFHQHQDTFTQKSTQITNKDRVSDEMVLNEKR